MNRTFDAIAGSYSENLTEISGTEADWTQGETSTGT